MDTFANTDIALLRHAIATLAYRASKVLRGAPPDFEHFRAASNTRTAVQIVAHMGDLFDWALTATNGEAIWHESGPRGWNDEVARFFAALKTFDERLASMVPLSSPPGKLFQGPVADALTHVGQLATLRRLAGSGIKGESYFRADIVAGRVGTDQSPPLREFD